MVFLIVGLLAGAAYVLLQLYYVHHWRKIPAISVPASYTPERRISVIVVAHNEEKTIEACVRGILHQKFPTHLLELIFIDDRSTDTTASILGAIDNPALKHIRLQDYPTFIHQHAYKKSGIELGVHFAKSELIVVTDADCKFQDEWLRNISFVMETKEPVFLTAPVLIANAKSSLEKMQAMENLSLILITGAGIQSHFHHIANGANMAFKKSAFAKVKGFEGNYQYASGDDMFLIEKMHHHFPDQITFLKSTNAVVTTDPKHNWTALLRQRIRWAKKNKGLADPGISLIWLFVGFYHVLILISIVASFFDLQFAAIALVLILLKWSADYLIIRTVSNFFQVPIYKTKFIQLQILYTIYIIRLGWDMITGKKGDW